MTKLSNGDYKIGGLDAWTDDKSFLHKEFILLKPFAELTDTDRCFLCGRRGSGKSAIAIMLGKKMNDLWDHYLVIEGEINTYGSYIDLISNLDSRVVQGLNIDIKRFIQLLWRYVLRVLIMQTVLRFINENELIIQKKTDYDKLVNYLASAGISNHDDIGVILVKVFRQALNSIGEYATDSLNAYAFLQNKCQSQDFKEAVAAIPVILGTKRIMITLDTLESYKIHSQSMKQGLKGIIAAILNILADNNLNNIGMRFFLPAEIYEDVSSEIPAKTAGITVFLRWKFADLIVMLTKRYMDMLKRTKSLESSAIANLEKNTVKIINGNSEKDKRYLRMSFWYENRFLPISIANSNGIREDCFAYILRHTQRRPRELIWVLNQIIKKAFENNELPYISEQSVKDGLHDRITLGTLLRDTLSPYEGYIEDITDRARAVFSCKKRVMSGIELKQFARAFYDVKPIDDITPDAFVNYLLRSGVIGQAISECADETTGYCTALFEYLMHDRVALNNSLIYYVHPMMGDFFNMENVDGFGVVYPIPMDDLLFEQEINVKLQKSY